MINFRKKAFVFSALLISHIGLFAQHITKDTYNNETEITAAGSVTLLPGFTIPAGKTVRIYTGMSFKECASLNAGLSANQNYITTRIFKRAGVTEANINGPWSTCDVTQTVQYLDGLGRALQVVQVQASPTFNDIVQPIAYDGYGRENKKFLPYSATGNNGTYRADGIAAQQNFYNAPAGGVSSIVNSAFSETRFEASPLNRVSEQGSPGTPWQLAGGHTQKIEYGANTTEEVKLWTITGNSATASYYLPGTLTKTISRDENWVAADGNAGVSEEFKDLDGRVVLKRNWKNNTEKLSTYYVYDDLGNLRYVLPPAVNEYGQSPVSYFNENEEVFKRFIYGYHYDGRQRQIEKKIPGKEWEYLVYNNLDQVVLTQDIKQRAANNWLYTKYDALGRITSTGVYNSTDAVATIRTAAATGGLNYPASGTDEQVLNYYDDYSFAGGNNYSYAPHSDKTKGLLTGKKVKILGSTRMLLSINFYDDERRVVKAFKQHHLGSTELEKYYDEIDNTYDFSGELTYSKRTHHVGAAQTIIATRYETDHVGRKRSVFESINGGTETALAKLDYNEVGQLLKKSRNKTSQDAAFLQSSDYTYNERGWLKTNSSGQFSFELKYDNASVPQYNGNISSMRWGEGSPSNTFTYQYDKINRLLVANAPGLSETISYDAMGNIQSLTRDGFGTNNYTGYNGNKLTQISGFTNSSYGYDDNGNLISDSGKGINLSYNQFNLPSGVSGSQNLTYTYDAEGSKLRKFNNATGVYNDYIDGVQYLNGNIEFIQTEEGLARNNGGSYTYEYNLTDHLGNVRYSFNKHPVTGAITKIQSDDYYAFGLRKIVNAGTNKYLYNGKELQEELGQYDYGARFYDPVIGRWNVIDAKSEKYYMHSPYNYALNNPIVYIDPDGNEIIFVVRGQDGQKDRTLTYRGGNAYWNDSGKKYEFKGANNTIARTLKAYQKIMASDDAVVKGQLEKIAGSKNHHFVEASMEGKNSVKPYGIPNEDGSVGTQTQFDFSDAKKNEFKKSEGVEATDLSTVTHELRHQYDNDIGNTKDNKGYSDASDPAEIRAVNNENRVRKIEKKPERTTYGGKKIDPDKLKNPPNNL